MYIQSTSFGISELSFTPGKRGMGFICLCHLCWWDTKQRKKPPPEDQHFKTLQPAACSIQVEGGNVLLWGCSPIMCQVHLCHNLTVLSPSPVNLFLVQLFPPLCYDRKVNMNYSRGLFCHHTRSRLISRVWTWRSVHIANNSSIGWNRCWEYMGVGKLGE